MRGKLVNPPIRTKAAQDHPRRCGENIKGVVENATTQGSPPQVRGKLVDIVVWVVGLRITPAGAGKTIKLFVSFSAGGDHPRRCGENGSRHKVWDAYEGSPPQVRGKQFYLLMLLLHCRITPAGAGKTLKYILLCPKWWDHPRRCGENKDPELLLMYILGSPPQVRGKLVWVVGLINGRRITPAGAGKTTL